MIVDSRTPEQLLYIRNKTTDTWIENDLFCTVFTLRDREGNDALRLSSEVVVWLIDNYLKHS